MIISSFSLFRNLYCVMLLSALMFSFGKAGPALAYEPEVLDRLLPIVGEALVSAGDQDWAGVSADLEQFEMLWQQIADDSASPEAKAAEEAVSAAKRAVQNAAADPEAARQNLSQLAQTVNKYVSLQQKDTANPDSSGKAVLETLLPFLQQSLSAVEQQDWPRAKAAYEQFVDGWLKAEGAVRSDSANVYGQIETRISLARIALNTEPPDVRKSTDSVNDLISVIDQYVKGTISASPAAEESKTLPDLIKILDEAEQAIQSGHAAEAAANMQDFIRYWPSVEGQVQIYSPQTYTDIENRMTQAPSLLLSATPDLEKANSVIHAIKGELEPIAGQSDYSAWDAGIILLREGLEALLVIAALLAFLNRTENADKRGWIWVGVGTGVIASGILAILLTLFVSKAAAGGSRELIEGITGLIAVVFMLTVGAWLHNKSSIKVWNQFIHRQIGAALSKGTLWSLAAVSFLAILREGAETIIFYLGMAPTISTSRLVLGIVGALIILVALGYALIRFSKRIPIRPFFLVASLLIYYLAFKFLGMSIHALQVADRLPAHVPGYLPTVSWLGMYPSWETTLPQLCVLLLVLFELIWTERKHLAQAAPVKNEPSAH